MIEQNPNTPYTGPGANGELIIAGHLVGFAEDLSGIILAGSWVPAEVIAQIHRHLSGSRIVIAQPGEVPPS